MEEPVLEQASAGASGNSARPTLQRYALRSSIKSKDQKPDAADLSNSAASKRGKPVSSVSKSVGVLDLSVKDNSTSSAKPPRRLSIPAKTSAIPVPKFAGNITPISETRTRRSANGQPRSDTPIPDISKPSSQKKYSTLSLTRASFWTSNIKVSEAAGKHSISLGFFKLALEAGVEPLKRMQDGLKSYVGRYQLTEFGDVVKELFEGYNISESLEQLQVSETISQVPEEGTRSSDEEVQSSSTTMGTGKLKPKCLNVDSAELSPVNEPTKKETAPKNNPGSRMRGNVNKNSANLKPGSEIGSRKLVKKAEKPIRQEPNKEKGKIRKQEKKSDEVAVRPSLVEDKIQGNKENMDVLPSEERTVTDVMQASTCA